MILDYVKHVDAVHQEAGGEPGGANVALQALSYIVLVGGIGDFVILAAAFIICIRDFHLAEASKLTTLQTLDLEVDMWQRVNSPFPEVPEPVFNV